MTTIHELSRGSLHENQAFGERASWKSTGLTGARLALVAVLALLLLSRRGPAQVGVSIRPRNVSHKRAVGRCLTASPVGTAHGVPRRTLAAKSVLRGSSIGGVRTVLERPRVAIQDRAEAVRHRGEGESRQNHRHNQHREKRPCAYLHRPFYFPHRPRVKQRRGVPGVGSLLLILAGSSHRGL